MTQNYKFTWTLNQNPLDPTVKTDLNVFSSLGMLQYTKTFIPATGTTSWTFNNIAEGSGYTWQVIAYDAAGKANPHPSSMKFNVVGPNTVPGDPILFAPVRV